MAIILYVAGIHLSIFFNKKARLWVIGRRQWRERYKKAASGLAGHQVLWMHVSSLGEFEQGRPIIEAFRESFPGWRLVLTFFSPSGFEIRKDYPLVDVVVYLPADTPGNARVFLDIFRPDAVIFVKYDFWANYLFRLKKLGIPTLLVSALFRPSQPFFKWYGVMWREMLGAFSHVFVQNSASQKLLQSIDYLAITVAGDTRVDRVLHLASGVQPSAKVAAFVGQTPVLVVGSSWESDEHILLEVLRSGGLQHFKIILAPHEPSEQNVDRICQAFSGAVRFSRFSAEVDTKARFLVIDNIGMLNTLYQYGKIAYIGGGFGKGIHNTLEPAAFGLPIVFGPKFAKFEEARQFVAAGGAFSIQNEGELQSVLTQLHDPDFYAQASSAVLNYLQCNKGATQQTIHWLLLHYQPDSPYSTDGLG
jgi:3-deoxy-D-manno-octulosonic-acid transferase